MSCPCLQSSPPGGSTLITSAPKSDKMTAALGPAMKLARSTTFNPEKMFSALFSDAMTGVPSCISPLVVGFAAVVHRVDLRLEFLRGGLAPHLEARRQFA